MGNTLTIFDLDNTLIQGDSSTVWSQFMVREGLATQKGVSCPRGAANGGL